jgi:PDZ domain-containing protein
MSRRTATLSVAAFLLVLMTALASLLPVPYVVLSPGPTSDTIGQEKGKDLITIKGRTSYPAEGDLRLTTVYASGGPGQRLGLATALKAWLDPDEAIVPEESVYPRGTTEDDVKRQNAEEMQLSQQQATAAALRALDIDITTVVLVQSVAAQAPALGVLKAGDVIVAVDGTKVTTPESVGAAIRAKAAGEPVPMKVLREDKPLDLQVPTGESEGRTVVGINPAEGFEFPFEVEYALEKVGGPSAGMMFALGIVDKLTPGSMTGGKVIAGTGTIDAAGKVGPIGGIQQKLRGARDDGAVAFLAPADNCAAAKLSVPDGLQLVKVATLKDARAAVEGIAAGRTDLPAC